MYFEGKAYELRNPAEMLTGLTVVYKREKRQARDVVEFLRKFPRRVYKFTPEKAWINGDREIEGNFIDIRTELDLTKLKLALFT